MSGWFGYVIDNLVPHASSCGLEIERGGLAVDLHLPLVEVDCGLPALRSFRARGGNRPIIMCLGYSFCFFDQGDCSCFRFTLSRV